MKTSAIEGEILDRRSVQSSLRRHLGLEPDSYPNKPREQGVAEMMVDVYSTYAEPLAHGTLFRWHEMLLAFDKRLEAIGSYRQQEDAMQIVSGRFDRPVVHFEAPPSAQVPEEMDRYVDWFSRTEPGAEERLPALTRAGLSHLYFESIHPFEDGNSRLSRALAEKSLAQSIGRPSLIALAFTLEQKRKDYYDQLRATPEDAGCHALASMVCRDRSKSAAVHPGPRGLLYCQGTFLRPIPRQAKRPAGQGDRADVPRRPGWLQGWSERRELYLDFWYIARNRYEGSTRTC